MSPDLWPDYLQRRIMRLLLTYDRALFRGKFATFYIDSSLPRIPLLEQYDRYIRLITLSDELLDDIMPRIRRQLSLQTNQVYLREEAPTRGDIVWPRTLERSWRETPGLVPTVFDTRLRRRSTATPPNVLAVAILLHYQQALQQMLNHSFHDEPLLEEERQFLIGMDERVTSELATPDFRALVDEASGVDVEVLVGNVQRALRSGPNPYRDLIGWWERFSRLRVGRRPEARQIAVATRREDEKVNAWLYELWIALEIVHFLYQQSAILPQAVSIESDLLKFTFLWNQRQFCFRYNRQWEDNRYLGMGASSNAPETRPDYIIEREDVLQVTHGGTLIWREPPVVLDAKFYLRATEPSHTHAPVKEMLGNLLLLDAKQGILFFPALRAPAKGKEVTHSFQPNQDRHHAGVSLPPQIQLYQLVPGMRRDALARRLRAVLDHATSHLPERPEIACHGVWLDADNVNQSRDPRIECILCPKPHIGPNVFDLVRVDQDCLKNSKVCHVIGSAILPPYVMRIPTTGLDVLKHADTLRARSEAALEQAEASGDEERAEALRIHLFVGVGRAVEQYVRIHGNPEAVEDTFERWVFGRAWKTDNRALTDETRNMLISGEYVWQEYRDTSLTDWAAPAIQFCRALEVEIKRRLYDEQKSYKLPKSGWTLGTPFNAYQHRASAHPNWQLMIELVEKSKADPIQFEQLMALLESEKVYKHRNNLAHGGAVSKEMAELFRRLVIGSREQPGALVWLAGNLNVLQ